VAQLLQPLPLIPWAHAVRSAYGVVPKTKGLPFRAKTNSNLDFKLKGVRKTKEKLHVWKLKFQSDNEIGSIFYVESSDRSISSVALADDHATST
jgi:hypothetical protein